MNNELIESPYAGQQQSNALAESAGSRGMQARESAQIMAMVAMAHRFPRDVIAATDKILNAFTRITLAEKAAYQYAKGGTDVSGPSIRAAEAMAQMWGNIAMGFSEVSRGIGQDGVPFSEVEAFAWDMEAGNWQPLKFIVRHWRDTKGGGYKIKDERDIYELMANQAQRRKRACILALIPGDVVEAAMKQADMTLRTKADTSPEAMVKMVDAFAEFGVTKDQIEKRIQRRLDSIQPAQVVALKRIYASLRDDMSTPGDWFDMEGAPGETPKPTAAPRTEPIAFPPEEFEKELPTWLDLIAKKKKTGAQIIAMVSSRGALSEEQKARILAKPQAAAVTVTYDEVKAKLSAATTVDALNLAADLIKAVEGKELQAELSSLYDARVETITTLQE